MIILAFLLLDAPKKPASDYSVWGSKMSECVAADLDALGEVAAPIGSLDPAMQSNIENQILDAQLLERRSKNRVGTGTYCCSAS